MAEDNTMDGLRRYFDTLRNSEDEKNQFIKRLIEQLEQTTKQNSQLMLDYEREQNYNREIQVRESKLQKEMRSVKSTFERSQFVLVLIDGDGMIFEDSLLQKGEAGGKEAAGLLWTAIRDYVQDSPSLQTLSTDYKIITRVYANERGLGDACYRSGITTNMTTIGDFARGFTGSKQLFDFVDVGSGKDRADEKLSELFRMNLENVHCRHILLGCSHDNGYARLLEEVSEHPNIDQITLLEGVPFERELFQATAKFTTHKFKDLFRNSKISVPPRYAQHGNSSLYNSGAQQQQIQPSARPPIEQENPASIDMPFNGSAGPIPENGHQSTFQEPAPRVPGGKPSPQMSWASTAGAAIPTRQTASPPTMPNLTNIVPRNKYGQRIDPLTTFDPADLKRVQKVKMCNIHYLRNDCPFGDNCTHVHDYKPTKLEIDILRQIARSTPCRFGTECDDVNCIYGHRCPYSVEGSKTCRFGSNCRFDYDMHGIDTKIVRTTKIS